MLSYTKSRFAGKQFLQTLFLFLLATHICFAQLYSQNSGVIVNLNGVTFIDANNGFAVGDSGIILKTTNGGNDWTIKSSGTTSDLRSVCFTDSSTGWISGGTDRTQNGTILKTIDGGNNWTEQCRRGISRLNSVCFTDSSTGWAVGCDGTILKTTDGGNDWTIKNSETTNDLWSVYFTDSNTGWTVGAKGTILKTTNGGNDWTIQSSGTDVHGLRSVCFIDSDIGWIAGGYPRGGMGIILKTTDSGNNWTSLLLGREPPNNKSVYFTNSNTGWIVGAGILMQTTDGGNDWIGICVYFMYYNSVYFVDSNTGWVVGDDGTILKTTTGDITFIEEEMVKVPTDYSISQNFPNPFNPSTKIRYSVPQSSNVIIKVLDVLGNEIETLVNEEKSTGTYEVEFNSHSGEVRNLPSGVYFYQLRAGDFIQTRKMILIK